MIEKTLLDHLSSRLDVPVGLEVPAKAPERFVVLMKSDSRREDFLYRSMFLVRSYGKTLMEAAELNELAKEAMFAATELPEVSGCYLTGDYIFTDTALKRYRYQAVFDIYHF